MRVCDKSRIITKGFGFDAQDNILSTVLQDTEVELCFGTDPWLDCRLLARLFTSSPHSGVASKKLAELYL